MKVRSKKDTITGTRKIKLLDRFDFNTSYNLAADSLQLNVIGLRGGTILFDKVNIFFNANWDPYVYDVKSKRRINTFVYEQSKKLARLTSANMSFRTSLNSSKKKNLEKPAGADEDEWNQLINNPNYYVDFNVPWNITLDYNLRLDKQINESGDTTIYTQTLNSTFDLSLTPNWKINVNTTYDIKNNKFSYTTIDIYRDLHCWQMRFSWVPFGQYQSYSFNLNVKSSLLQDLKISRRKGWNDFNY